MNMSAEKVASAIKVGVLGFGGLGQAAARVLAPKREMAWVAAARAMPTARLV